MTYARARLLLGVSGVGFMVVVSAAALLLGLPVMLFSSSLVPLPQAVIELSLYFVCVVLLLFPFDLIGGFLLPKWFGRSEESFGTFVKGGLRAVVVYIGAVLFCSALLLAAAREFTPFTSFLLVPVLCFTAVAFQHRVFAAVAGIRWEPEIGGGGSEVVVDLGESFTGGIVGLPGFDRVLVPKSWKTALSAEELDALVSRRQAIVASGARARGVLGAVAWVTLGFTLSLAVPGASLLTPAGLVTLSLVFTLWSFIGLLLLPRLSREGVIAGDRAALRAGVQREVLASAIKGSERLQDDELERSAAVESVFHPITAAKARITLLNDEGERTAKEAMWNVARLSLFLSGLLFSTLGRAVHCNAGRPHLWVLLPVD